MNITQCNAFESFRRPFSWSTGSKVFKLFVIGLTAAAMAFPASAQEEEDEEDPEAKKVVVTGSRIKRLDVETPNPVVVITREDLDATGFSTVGDALRALPYNTGQSLVAEDSGTSFTPGVSSLNLRGLGNNNTLVLINNRRAAPFGASGFNGFQTVFDFNSVPASAIDSIEILKDGASAVYGSDAVAGVINIKLRRDFEGLNTQVSASNLVDTDAFEKSLFFMLGTTTAKTSIVTTFDYVARNGVAMADLDFTDNIDLRIDKSNNSFFSPIPNDPNGRFDIDWRSSRSFPARFVLPQDANGLAAGSTVTLNSLSTSPSASAIIPITRANPDPDGNSPGYYNFLGNQEGNSSNFLPETEFWGFYTSATHELTDTVSLFGELSFRRANSVNNAAPAPLSSLSENGDGAQGNIVLPASNPFNPLGVDIDNFAWRMHDSGPRINDVTADYPRIVIGATGDIGFTWTWETGVMWTQADYTNRNPGSVFDRQLQDALNGIDIEGVTLYANPFGPTDPRVTDYYTGTNPNVTDWEVLSYDANFSGELFDMPAGPAGLAIGLEYREEAFNDSRTIDNEIGNLVGGSQGTGFSGQRDVLGAFAEISLPIHRMVELQGAVRHEEYSDFGGTTKPKIAAKFRPFDWLLIRGSFSQAFKAPDLPFLFSPGSVSFTSNPVIDPKRPNDTANQIRTVGVANPDLQPEETDVTYVGFQWEPGDELFNGILDGLTLGADLFIFDQTDLITRASAQTVIENEDNPNFTGGEVVRLNPVPGDPNPVGVIAEVTTGWVNADTFKYEGVDLSATYTWDTENYGNFRTQVIATWLSEFSGQDTTDVDQVGEYLVPRWRATGTFAWTRGDWAASIFANWVDGYNDDFGAFLPDVDDYLRTNLQVSYRGWMDTNITVGLRNALDNDPPLDWSNGGSTFAAGVINPEPRAWYIRVGKNW